ncbi:hypothetical protein C0Z18_22940 [Trinickia dabaoshanensis]|uniref:Type III effector protein n=1 Tax=Trinickia dabaoshanensis TaxID=564714 RepID=A0A2N7VHT0_9BURK|nr:hypothetical protein C0Z18_22940 [Trinickia dabaoshanensis]
MNIEADEHAVEASIVGTRGHERNDTDAPRGATASTSEAFLAPPATLPDAVPERPSMAKRAGATLRAHVQRAFSCFTAGGTARRDWETPFTSRSRIGATTPLRDYAAVKHEVEQSAAARNSAAENPAARPEVPPELGAAMDKLKTELTKSTQTSAKTHAAPPSLPGERPVQAEDVLGFWRSPAGQALAAKAGTTPEAFLDQVDAMAAAHSPETALLVSLALASAKLQIDPERTTSVDEDVFSYLKSADLRSEILNARGASTTSRETHILKLRAGLDKIFQTLQQNRLTSPSPEGPPMVDVRALQAFTQAARDLPVAMRSAALPELEPLRSWPSVHDSASRFHNRNATAAVEYLAAIDALDGELNARGGEKIAVSHDTADLIKRAQESLISFVSNPIHLREYDARLKQAEMTRSVAWGALQHAAATSGFSEALAAVGNHGLTDADKENLRFYLQASSVVAAALNAKPTPEALIIARLERQAPMSSAANFAQRVSEASEKLLAHAADPTVLSPSDKADLFSWRNGFTDDAPGSDLRRTKERLYKCLTWIDRREHDGSGLLPRKHKSPLSAARSGIAGGNRAVLANEEKKLKSELTAPEVDQVVKALAEAMEKWYQTKPATDANADNQVGQPADSLSDQHCEWIALRVALEDWLPEHAAKRTLNQLISGRSYSDGDLPEAVVALVREHTKRAVEKVVGGSPEAIERAVDQAAMNVQQRLRNKRIGFKSIDALADYVLHLEDGSAFKKAMRATENIADAWPRTPADTTPESVRDMLIDFVKDIPGGNTVRLIHGSSKGFSTKGITKSALSTTKRIFAHIPVALTARVEVRYEGARDAVVSFALPVHAAEIFVGTEKRHRGRLGAGGFFGVKLWKLYRAGYSVDVTPYEHERIKAAGAMLRIPRRDAARDKNVRDLAARITEFLFAAAKTRQQVPGSMADADAFFRDFADEFYAERDLSLSWVEQKSRGHRSEFSTGLGASAVKVLDKHEPQSGSIALSLGYAFEKQWDGSYSQLDESGTFRILNLRALKYTRHKVSAALTTSTITGSTGDTSADLFGATAVLAETGAQAKLRLAVDNRKLLPLKSVADFEFDSARYYIRYIESTKQEWIDMFAHPHRNDPDNGQAKGLAAVNEHIETIRRLNKPYNAFYARRHLTEQAADTLNRLEQLSRVTPPGEHALHRQIAAQWQSTIAAPGSWLPVGLRSYEKYSEADSFKVSAGFRYAQTTGLRVERQTIFDTIGVPALKEREQMLKAKAVEMARETDIPSTSRETGETPAIRETTTTPTPAFDATVRPPEPETEAPEASFRPDAAGVAARRIASAEIEEAAPEHGHSVGRSEGDETVGRQRRRPTLLDLFNETEAEPPRPRTGVGSERPAGAARGGSTDHTAAETRAHLQRIKEQLDTKAGIAPAAKKSRGLSRLLGRRSKPR